MGTLEFSVDKKKVTEGGYVMVNWNCDGPDAVTLTVDNGISSYNIQLADSGSRAIVMDKPKNGKTVIRLNAVYNGKADRKEATIKVEAAKAPKKEKASTSGGKWKRQSGRAAYGQSFKDRLKSAWYNVKYTWQTMPPKRRRIYKIMFAVLLALWLFLSGQRSGYNAGYQDGLRATPQNEQNVQVKLDSQEINNVQDTDVTILKPENVFD